MPYEPELRDPYLVAELKTQSPAKPASPLVVRDREIARRANIRSTHAFSVLELESRKTLSGEFAAVKLAIDSPDGRPNVITLSHEATRALIGFLQESL